MSVSEFPSIGLYLHIPFCRTKCHYCDFNAYAGIGHLRESYAAALEREIALLAERHPGVESGTLFFGGGTPSLMPPELIGRLIERCRERLGLRADAEVTLEANPRTIDLDGLCGLRAAGVNRVSFGVQSLEPEGLRALGRDHSAEDAIVAYEQALAAGIDNVNLDFIYGWPGQTRADWERDLDRMTALRPAHLSLYALTVESGTPLARLVGAGKVSVGDDDLMADLYERAELRLAAAGYRHYEISNWARFPLPGPTPPGAGGGGEAALVCEHNLYYWRRDNYLGLGAGAHSLWGRRRYSNVLAPAEYVRRLETGADPVVMSEELDDEDVVFETAMLGLRLDTGLDCEEYVARFGELAAAALDILRGAASDGLVSFEGNVATLTPRGRLLANEVFVRLLG
ncbi:MAG: radical SAM family heme chaperone HemW [Chloroflexi bacterium]|nr:radical SAM family heme chaperone HemW [Chloroflexota bacterium]